jgi:hypothetical protein
MIGGNGFGPNEIRVVNQAMKSITAKAPMNQSNDIKKAATVSKRDVRNFSRSSSR